jgi:dephospho-CoA kinase
MTLPEALRRYQRIAICGGPRTGKSTLAKQVTDRQVIHTDDYMGIGWSEASAAVAAFVNNHPGMLVVEGVAVPRALRKGMRVDAVIWLPNAHAPLTVGQSAMAKGCRSVFDEWMAANPTVPVIWGIA